MSNKEELMNQIEGYCKELKLPATRQSCQEHIEEANRNNYSYEQFLHQLLQQENDLRRENSKKNRIRLAGFPTKKYLEDLEVDALPDDARKKLKLLSSLEFIKNGQNVILSGNAGTGKTSIAIGLGLKACMEGYKVLFVTVPRLVNQLKESRSAKILKSFENKFERYDLVIADELGYISFDKEGSELLFTHLSLRAGRKSTIITSNLSFERWDEIFKDPVMTAAMVDRLTHKSYVINMVGSSYRMKETRQWLEEQSL